MTEERPYRTPMAPAEALAELRSCAGTQFDPVWSSCSPSMSFRGSAPIPPPGCRRRPSRPGSPRRSPRPVRRAQGCSQAANLHGLGRFERDHRTTFEGSSLAAFGPCRARAASACRLDRRPGAGRGRCVHRRVGLQRCFGARGDVCLMKGPCPRSDRWIWLAFGPASRPGPPPTSTGPRSSAMSSTRPIRRLPTPAICWLTRSCTSACALGPQSGSLLAGAWLDGAIGGLAAAALATAILSPALIGLTSGDPAASRPISPTRLAT